MSKTRFQETFLDFAEESIREDNYRGVDIRSTDPYGYWVGDGIPGYFTSRHLLESAIDAQVSKKAVEKAVEAAEPPKVTKKITTKKVD